MKEKRRGRREEREENVRIGVTESEEQRGGATEWREHEWTVWGAARGGQGMDRDRQEDRGTDREGQGRGGQGMDRDGQGGTGRDREGQGGTGRDRDGQGRTARDRDGQGMDRDGQGTDREREEEEGTG